MPRSDLLVALIAHGNEVPEFVTVVRAWVENRVKRFDLREGW